MNQTNNTIQFSQFAAVSKDSDEVLGKILYYTLSSILIDREVLARLCDTVDFPYKPIRRSSLADAFRSATGDIYRNGQAWKKFRLSGGIASFARQWSTGIQLRRRPKRCRAAQCEGRQGAMVCLRPKRRGLLHPLSVQGVHAYGRPMAL